jgi:tetratricopeptide (TPR) repeat protein
MPRRDQRAGQWRRALDCYRLAMGLYDADPRNRLSLAIAESAWDSPVAAQETLRPWAEPQSAAPIPPLKEGGKTAAARDMSPAMRALGIYTLAYAQEESGRLEEALASYRRARQAAEEAGGAEPCGVAEQARLAAQRLAGQMRSLKAEGSAVAYARAATLFRDGLRKKAVALKDRDAFALARQKLWAAGNAAEAERLRQEEPLRSLHDAMRCFQEALQAYPRFPRAHAELGLCRLALVEQKTALPHLEAAAVYDPLSPGVLAALGECRLSLGAWEAAAETFRKLVSLDPECAPANLGLARLALHLGRTERDLDLAREALFRARLLGTDPRMAVKVHQELETLAEKLRRGEKPPAARARPAPPGAKPRTAPEGLEIWRGSILDY